MAKSAKTPEVEIMKDEPEFKANLELTNTDLANIAVAEYENTLAAEQKEKEKEVARLRKNSKEIEEQLEREMEERAEEEWGEVAKALAKALKDFNGQEFEPRYSAGSLEKKGKTELSVTVANHSTSKEIATTSSWKALRESIEENSKQTDVLEQRLFEIKKDLSNVSRIERQAKAALARAALEGSDKGKKLLSSISNMKNLPKLLKG